MAMFSAGSVPIYANKHTYTPLTSHAMNALRSGRISTGSRSIHASERTSQVAATARHLKAGNQINKVSKKQQIKVSLAASCYARSHGPVLEVLLCEIFFGVSACTCS